MAAGDFGNFVSSLTDKIDNGKSEGWRCRAVDEHSKGADVTASGLMTPVRAPRFPPTPIICADEYGKDYHQVAGEYATSSWKQLYVLLKRNVIRLSRDKVTIN